MINFNLFEMIISLSQENYSTHSSHYSSLRPIIEQCITIDYSTIKVIRDQHNTVYYNTSDYWNVFA